MYLSPHMACVLGDGESFFNSPLCSRQFTAVFKNKGPG